MTKDLEEIHTFLKWLLQAKFTSPKTDARYLCLDDWNQSPLVGQVILEVMLVVLTRPPLTLAAAQMSISHGDMNFKVLLWNSVPLCR